MADFKEPVGRTVVPLRDQNERRFLARHLEGDESAFGELLAAYRSPVYGYLARCGINAATRDDLFQEIFLKIHRAAASYDPERPFRPWLFTIAANTVRNHFRDRKDPGLSLDANPAFSLAASTPGPQRQAEARETAAWIEEALDGLPLAHREAVVLCCIEGLDQKTAAESLGIPVNTLKTHLRRGRLALARELARLRSAETDEERT